MKDIDKTFYAIGSLVLLISIFLSPFQLLPKNSEILVEEEGWKQRYGQSQNQCNLIQIGKNESKANLRELLRANIPFVLKGFSLNWPARTKWNKHKLSNAYGNRQVKTESESGIVFGGGTVSASTKFGEVLSLITECTTSYNVTCSDNFVFDTAVLRSIPELQKDIEISLIFNEWKEIRTNHLWHILSLGAMDTGKTTRNRQFNPIKSI
jgi:hypothetical protein